MDQFFLQPFSLHALTQALLALFTVLYLIRINERSRATWMLILAIGGFMLLWASEFFNLSSTNNYSSISAMMGPVLLFGFLHFAYAFLDNPFPRESKVVFWATLAGVTGFALYHASLLIRSNDTPESIILAQELFSVSLILWAALVFWRKKLRLEQSEGGLLLGLFRAEKREAQALRAYALLMLAILPLNFRTIWSTILPSDLWTDSIQYLGFSVLLIAFVVIYINHSSKPTTFMVKLVGLSLATVLVILGLTTLILYPDAELRQASRAGLPALQSLRFESEPGGGYRVAHLPLQFDTKRGDKLNLAVEGDTLVSLGFTFPFYGKEWDEIFIDSNGLITFGERYQATQFQYFFKGVQPKIAPYYRALIPMSSGRSGVFFKQASDKAIVTWYRVRERYDEQPGNENSFQVILYKSGAIEFVYDTMEAQSIYGFRGLHPGGSQALMEPGYIATSSAKVITHALLAEGQTIRFEPDKNNNYEISKTPAHYDIDLGENLQLINGDDVTIPLNFPFPFFGEIQDSLIISDNGVVTMEHSIYSSQNAWFNPYDPIYADLPIIAPFFDDFNPLQGGSIFFKQGEDSATITWYQVSRFGSENPNTVQLHLLDSGVIEFTYEDINIPNYAVDLWGLYSGRGHPPVDATRYLMVEGSAHVKANVGVFEDFSNTDELAFLRYRHDRMLPFLYLIIGSSFFILTIFPLFFRFSLIQPLTALLRGVQHVNEGDLHVHVPVRVNDEIGVLSKNFNNMTATLKDTRQQLESYAEGLEEEVKDRTATLQETLQHLTETQNQLIQAEKMASLGKLTAGIAHEIENPLNFINNFAQLTCELVDELEEELVTNKQAGTDGLIEILTMLKANASKINEQGQRADSIVKGMLAHSRSRPGTREPTNLNKLLTDCTHLAHQNLIARYADFSIQIQNDYDDAIGIVEMMPGEMTRAFLNLLNNAFYAVHQKAMVMDGPYDAAIRVTTKRLEEQVEICICDNGPGIPPHLQDKIFEPFFTTKPTGSGNTGLGLSLSYDIIKQGHGGTLKVESIEYEGATFTITLPT